MFFPICKPFQKSFGAAESRKIQWQSIAKPDSIVGRKSASVKSRGRILGRATHYNRHHQERWQRGRDILVSAESRHVINAKWQSVAFGQFVPDHLSFDQTITS